MKEAEVDNGKLGMKINHMNKIFSEYKIETEIMSNTIIKACEVIQEDYLLLRSLKELDNDTLEKYQKIVKMLQGQRSVKFADDDSNLTSNITDENVAFQTLNVTSDDDHHYLVSPTLVSRKRANGTDEEDDHDSKKSKNDFEFARPKAIKSIQFDSIAPPSTTEKFDGNFDMNATFNLDSGQLPILNERTNSLAPGSKFAPKSKMKNYLIDFKF